MEKLDLKKKFKELYAPSAKEVSFVDVPKFNYLMIDGEGEPDSTSAQSAISGLFAVSYKLKFTTKARGQDYAVMPLEGLWWADDMNDFTSGNRKNWKWTYMIMQPDFISKSDFELVIEKLEKEKRQTVINQIRFANYEEGSSAQIMHLGPYNTEAENIQKIHKAIIERQGVFNGHMQKHHEIYLSDPRKVAPNKMKTVLRQPFLFNK